LFANEGYEETTTEQIAAHAGVSRRTFYYYFSSKADILFSLSKESLDRLQSAVASQPPNLSDLEAIGQAWSTFEEWSTETIGALRTRVAALRKAASSSTVLRGRQYETHLAYEGALARGLAARRGVRTPDDSMRLAAAIGQTIVNVAMTEWTRPGSGERRDVVDSTFALARSVIRGTSLNS
jgi:AcrR family transcriptional regulator